MTKFIKCEQCNAVISGYRCEFAIYKQIVNGKEHVFCCEKCAERYEKKRRE